MDEPVLEVSPWLSTASGRREGPATAAETQRTPAPISPAVGAGAAPSAALIAELNGSLARLRQRFRDVTAVVEGLGGLRSLGGEEALIEMAMFAQSHEHTLEVAWAALADCEQLARKLGNPTPSLGPEAGPISSAPTSTERVPPTPTALEAA